MGLHRAAGLPRGLYMQNLPDPHYPVGAMTYFTIEKLTRLTADVKATIQRAAQPIPAFRFMQGPAPLDLPGAHLADFDDLTWQEFCVGDLWGGYDVTAWFRTRVRIPTDWRGRKVSLHFLVGPKDGGNSTAETLLYVDGVPLQGIDVWHEYANLPPEVASRGEVSIALKAWSGMYAVPAQRRFKLAELALLDEAAERFYYRADTILRTIRQLDPNDLRRARLMAALDRAFLCVDFAEVGSEDYYASLVDANGCLDRNLADLATGELKPTVTGIGHSHIDLAWMWPLNQTREKAARTFSTALNLMRQYPEYRFMHSSPQLYKLVQQDHPEIYSRVVEQVAAGRWEATGGMWVEADTNLPGGESLVRQILFGKRFVRREFGLDSQVLWLPDSFGFSWTLPQLMARSGLKVFVTAAISWMRYSRFPHDTFRWRGLDGSEVLVNMITTPGEYQPNQYTYIGRLEPYDVAGSWAHYRQKDVNSEVLLPFGWGDGGGGPTLEMLETARAEADLPGLPRVQLDRVEPTLARIAERVEDAPLPVWDGELYLESSQGCYTSQARTKQANRRAERVYHAAEWLAACADILHGTDAYPQAALNAGWELILLNQFHDILSGTSIERVHRESLAQYAEAIATGEQAAAAGRARIAAHIRTDTESLVVFNPTGWPRSDTVSLPWSPMLEGKVVLVDGQPAAMQIVDGPEGKQVLVSVKDVPAFGYRAYEVSTCDAPATCVTRDSGMHLLENRFWRIELNAAGQIASLYDKTAGREVLAHGQAGNVLQVFEDRSHQGEAWDVDSYYADKVRVLDRPVEVVAEESGPVRGSVRLAWRLGKSTVTQRLTLYADSPRIDFRTEVDWHHHEMMLKVAFPVAVRATWATYEIQFGSIERPTHRNTSFDAAKYEVPAQKWADLSEGNYGVALLNDAKYGYDAAGNVLRLTLHRSPTQPDPNADQGLHRFTYSLLPHAGTWRESRVMVEAAALNDPLAGELVPAQQDAALPDAFSLVTSETDGLIIETVKRAEDERAYIVRTYEAKQYRTPAASLRFGRPISRAVECNLMEEDEQPVTVDGDRLTFSLAPFEIRTFKVWFV